MFKQNLLGCRLDVSAIRQPSRCAAVVAAAAAALLALSASRAGAAPETVTGLNTLFIPGATTTSYTESGGGAADSQADMVPSKTYTLDYEGGDLQVQSLLAGGQTYDATGTGTTVVRRETATEPGAAPDTSIIWYQTPSPINSSTFMLAGPKESDVAQAFSGNNLLVGADNIFGNTGNEVNNDTNIERLDELFPAFTASPTQAFAVFDRGLNGQHDSFQIAAITAVSNGAPTNFGPLVSFSEGSWGNVNLEPDQNYLITRTPDGASEPQQPTDFVNTQTIGGVLVTSSDLVPAGTTIYGYAIFPADVPGSTTSDNPQLADWTNPSNYPTSTDAITTGGLDPLGTTAVLYTILPEPSPWLLGMAVAAVPLLTRRRRQASAV